MCMCHAEKLFEFNRTTDKDQTSFLQLKCEGSIAIWLRNMEDNQGDNEEDPDIHQRLPEENSRYSLVRDNEQQGTLGEDRTYGSKGMTDRL